MASIKRIAVSTGGGDAPGLNAVIRAVVLSARRLGWQVIGLRRGFDGLLDISQTIELTEVHVRGIARQGGTILGTTNKGHPFEFPTKQPDGTMKAVDRSAEILANFKKLKLDALVSIGGDGSLKIAKRLFEMGMPVVGVPKTIDNDLAATVATFGFDTAVNTAADAIDKLQTTAEAHERVFVVEVMGRYTGWIALNSGVSSSVDVILIPEIPFDIEKVCDVIRDRESRGRHYSIVVASEGARPEGRDYIVQGEKEMGREVRLGGVSAFVAAEINRRTGKETRTMVLGHLQRGGSPSTFDRLIALRFGAAAVEAIRRGQFGNMVALNPPTVNLVSLTEATARLKTVPLDCDTIKAARTMGIGFGD